MKFWIPPLFQFKDPPAFTCPVCGSRSFNPNDVRELYCGRCHTFPEGRAMKLREFKPGDSFCLEGGGVVFPVLEHVAGPRPLVRCSSKNARLGKLEDHVFSGEFQGIPIAFAGAR